MNPRKQCERITPRYFISQRGSLQGSSGRREMSDQGTSVTLIFYKVGQDWWREPALNLIAAAAQFSSYTHVELAIGETAGSNGQMANVVRIFNDPHGVVNLSLPALPIRSS